MKKFKQLNWSNGVTEKGLQEGWIRLHAYGNALGFYRGHPGLWSLLPRLS